MATRTQNFSSREEAEAYAAEVGGEVQGFVRGGSGPDAGSRRYQVTWDDGGLSDFDETSADIPIWGWLTGADARRDRWLAEQERKRSEERWGELGEQAPTAADLAVDYAREGSEDEFGSLRGGQSYLSRLGPGRQQRALAQLINVMNSGGYTEADRAASRQMAMQQGQLLRGANDAALQQMQARGMGGGGAELAARLQGSQSYAMGNAMGDAAVQQAAMQRLMQATQGYGSLAGQMYGQEMARRNAIDEFNRRNLDWRRGRAARNTERENRSRESAAEARQRGWENRFNTLSGMEGKGYLHQQNVNRQADRQDQANRDAAGVIGSVIGEIL